MEPFDAYVMYLALKRHFTSNSYDYVKYSGKVNASIASFDNRKDRYQFKKLSKKDNLESFLVANFIINPKIWVGELTSNQRCDIIYNNWMGRQQQLSKMFADDLEKLDDNFKSNFNAPHPTVLKLLLNEDITLETFIILEHLLDLGSRWSVSMKDDPMWGEIHNKCNKYKPFLGYDIIKMKKLVVKHIEENEE